MYVSSEMAFVSISTNQIQPVLNFCSGRAAVSSDLVPGDVYEVSDPSLSQLPCDSLLLAGDCIINESMLTGANYTLTYTAIRLT